MIDRQTDRREDGRTDERSNISGLGGYLNVKFP